MTAASAPRDAGGELTFIYEARAASAVLSASNELGVLRRLEQGPVDVFGLAAECRLRPRAARALLTALAAVGLVEGDGRGVYRAVVRHLGTFMELLRPWDGLTDALRRDLPDTDGGTESLADVWRHSPPHLASLFAGTAVAAAERLSDVAPQRVLDLRAGGGPWSLALASRNPSCQVTAVDLGDGLESARQAAAVAACADRFRFLEADPLAVNFDDGTFDLVIAANLCHFFAESTNRDLIARVSRWLAPGGTVALVDVLSNERQDGPRVVALFDAGLLHRAPGGQVYPFSAYAGWLRAAGFKGVERIPLSSYPPATLIRARRPMANDPA